jgi:hypothetical protein
MMHKSRALWNRNALELESDEILAQLMDRGEVAAWRELFALAKTSAPLRQRIVHICLTVPIGFPYLFLAAMAALGERTPADPKLPREVQT